MVTSDSRVEQSLMRVELRSATTPYGAQFVMISGGQRMPMWLAGSWDSLQQEQLPFKEQHLAQELIPSSWTM